MTTVDKSFKTVQIWGTRLAQLVERETLDLGIVGLSSTLGIEIT